MLRRERAYYGFAHIAVTVIVPALQLFDKQIIPPLQDVCDRAYDSYTKGPFANIVADETTPPPVTFCVPEQETVASAVAPIEVGLVAVVVVVLIPVHPVQLWETTNFDVEAVVPTVSAAVIVEVALVLVAENVPNVGATSKVVAALKIQAPVTVKEAVRSRND